MERIFGVESRNDRLIVHSSGRAILFYGFGTENGSGFDYRHTFDHKPSQQEVVDVLTAHIDELTRERILSGCEFDGCRVWLSQENQANYTAAFMLASAAPDTLPYIVKMESLSDGSDVFREFTTVEDLGAFVRFFRQHIDAAQAAGWRDKSYVKETSWLPD